jgi:diketogulonate reductase-like aldo/keto reductase
MVSGSRQSASGTSQSEDGNAQLNEVVKTALGLGYHHNDGTTAYGNEEEIGQPIKESIIPREDVHTTSKPQDMVISSILMRGFIKGAPAKP